MDSFELNKILGALLGVLVFVVGLGILSEVLFEQEALEKAGFSVEVPEASSAGGPAVAVEEDPPVASLMASADAAKGEQLFRACAACHTIDKGGPNRVGPNLYGVLGGPKTHQKDFNYSKAMQEAATKGPWDYDAIYHFVKKPTGYVPGTAMAYAGLKKPKDRADLIAYLRAQSDSPAPLPAAPAEASEKKPAAPEQKKK
ncbi:MAG: cytochrome c family protein [Pseudomonadota bacterium]